MPALSLGSRTPDATGAAAAGATLNTASGIHATRAWLRRRGPVLVGLLLLALLSLVVGVSVPSLVLVVLGAAVAHGVDVTLHERLVHAFPLHEQTARAELAPRLLLVDALVVAFLLRSHELSSAGEVVVVLALVLHQAVRTGHAGLVQLDAHLRNRLAELRGLVGPAPLPPQAWGVTGRGVLTVVHAPAVLVAALLVTLVTGSYATVVPGAVLSVVLAAAVVLSALPTVRAALAQPRGEPLVRIVAESVRQHEPTVILYSNGGVDDLQWVTAWQDTLDQLPQRALIMLRNPRVLGLLPPCDTPIVCLPRPRDIVAVTPDSARVGLFVASSGENSRLLRVQHLRSAFVGHGDSDKAASANPASKMYDEVWVAGDAGRRRYLEADTGVVPDRIRLVGRPQTRLVRSAAHRTSGAPYTVLYAPTWEGVYGNALESSLVHSGRQIVQELLELPDVRVLYRPHPKSGERSEALRTAHREILVMLEAAGAPHRVFPAGSTSLYDCFNDSDALVADVSAVVSDFIASDKPYFVVNGSGLTDGEFRTTYRSAAGAYLVRQGGAGLLEGLADAQHGDSMAAARLAARVDLIGPPTDDPLGVFADAIDRLAATVRVVAAVSAP